MHCMDKSTGPTTSYTCGNWFAMETHGMKVLAEVRELFVFFHKHM